MCPPAFRSAGTNIDSADTTGNLAPEKVDLRKEIRQWPSKVGPGKVAWAKCG